MDTRLFTADTRPLHTKKSSPWFAHRSHTAAHTRPHLKGGSRKPAAKAKTSWPLFQCSPTPASKVERDSSLPRRGFEVPPKTNDTQSCMCTEAAALQQHDALRRRRGGMLPPLPLRRQMTDTVVSACCWPVSIRQQLATRLNCNNPRRRPRSANRLEQTDEPRRRRRRVARREAMWCGRAAHCNANDSTPPAICVTSRVALWERQAPPPPNDPTGGDSAGEPQVRLKHSHPQPPARPSHARAKANPTHSPVVWQLHDAPSAK